MNLYRIMDFFELLQTVRTGKLRIPSAKRFSDPNELIGHLFSTLISPSNRPLTEESLIKTIRDQDIVLRSQYISCWTKTRDSIAMWEIYSSQKNGVQIEVLNEDFEKSLNDFTTAHSFAKGHKKEPDDPEILYYPPRVGECNYRNISKIYGELKEFASNKNEALYESYRDEDKFKEVWRSFDDEWSKKLPDLLFLKDEAYRHEDEMRYCLQAVCRNGREYDADKMDVYYREEHLRLPTSDQLEDNIFVPFPVSNIQTVWIDGRCPDWLAKLQTELLSEHGLSVARSHAYGSFMDRTPIEKWWD